MRTLLRTMVLTSLLAAPLAAFAGDPNDTGMDTCRHHAKAECTCARTAETKTTKAEAAPSEFVRMIWTSP